MQVDLRVIDKNTFIKSKNFKYKKNKRGKRIKVYFEDPSEEENTPVNTNTTIVYQDEDGNTSSAVDSTFVYDPIPVKVKVVAKTKMQKPKKITAYKVKSGDTLSKIARNNGCTVKDICKLNKIAEDAVLSLGKKIKLK